MSLKLDALIYARTTGYSRLNKLKRLLDFDLVESLHGLVNEYKDAHHRDCLLYDLERLLETLEESGNIEAIVREIDSLERELQVISNEIDNYNVR